MLPVRVAFDPSLPVVTAGSFVCGKRPFAADEPFPWRDLGMSEGDLLAFWRAGLVAFVPITEPITEPPASSPPPTKRDDRRARR